MREALRRTNFAGREVTLAQGVAVAIAVPVLTGLAGMRGRAAAAAGIGVLGLADDLLEPIQRRRGAATSKGLRGHARALREGTLTTGAAKAIGIPVLCVAAALTETGGPRRSLAARGAGAVLDGAIAAGTANLVNLLDLRPGRALKASLLLSALAAASPRRLQGDAESPLAPAPDARERGRALGAAAAGISALALPVDLREKGMLGDTGANALGAMIGTALALRLQAAPGSPASAHVRSAAARGAALLGLSALTLASERVSFSAVIEANPALRALDALGRRGAP